MISELEPIYVDIDNVARWLSRGWFDGGRPFDELKNMVMKNITLPFMRAIFKYTGRAWVKEMTGVFYITAAAYDTFEDEFRCLNLYDGDWRWLMNYQIYKWSEGVPFDIKEEPNFVMAFGLYEDGDVTPAQYTNVDDVFLENIDQSIITTTLVPVFFATSLMHCRNVELIDKPISRQMRRQAERKGKPLIQYKMLVIEPFKKQVQNEVWHTGENEIHRALHICRGHFATYTEEKPLFGKYAGTYWKPMHVRGNSDFGQVIKDYKVEVDKS